MDKNLCENLISNLVLNDVTVNAFPKIRVKARLSTLTQSLHLIYKLTQQSSLTLMNHKAYKYFRRKQGEKFVLG